MIRYPALLLSLLLWTLLLEARPAAAQGKSYLEQATITALRNRVHLKPKDQATRTAKQRDTLLPGDALATAQASLAQLRFNDGTLARMGEKAVFRFMPQQRHFRLSRGTVLLLIPPGQGRTEVKTPNVLTGIRGSALFVRHIESTNTTLVGALTNSGIEVTTGEDAPVQVLKAGQMAVIVDDKIEGLYEFDLQTFYETSPLAQGLDAACEEGAASTASGLKSICQADQSLDAVQEEMSEGMASQLKAAQRQTTALVPAITNPGFVRLPQDEAEVAGVSGDRAAPRIIPQPPNPELDALEATGSSPRAVFGIMPQAQTSPTVMPPPVSPAFPTGIEPPIVRPTINSPIIDNPVNNPVINNPVISNPIPENPVIDNPVVDNPVIDNPIINQPVIDEPIINEPIINEPIINEPVIDEPVIDSPIINEPVSDNVVGDNLMGNDLVSDDFVGGAPVIDDPVLDDPVLDDPVLDDPVIDAPALIEPEINSPAPEMPVAEEPMGVEPVFEPIEDSSFPGDEPLIDGVGGDTLEASSESLAPAETAAEIPQALAPEESVDLQETAAPVTEPTDDLLEREDVTIDRLPDSSTPADFNNPDEIDG